MKSCVNRGIVVYRFYIIWELVIMWMNIIMKCMCVLVNCKKRWKKILICFIIWDVVVLRFFGKKKVLNIWRKLLN